MSVIMISRGSFSGGRDFAEKLAAKLDYRCLSREELAEEAMEAGIPVGRLQTAVVKPPRVAKRLTRERELYLSFVTSRLCEYALEDNLIYHGHTGHQLLIGIPNLFRIRVHSKMEYRIENVMKRLNLDREGAISYIRNVDVDRDKWVRFLYGIDWLDPAQYDIIVNLAQVEVSTVTTALCGMAKMSEFVLTPAATNALQNLKLASEARYRLAMDKRTREAEFKVNADNGILQVTCMPHQADVAPYVEEILQPLEDCREVYCTIAGSNILLIGEQVRVDSEFFSNLVKVAKRWDAAIEIMRFSPEEDSTEETSPAGEEDYVIHSDNGGTGEVEAKHPEAHTGVSAALDELKRLGCAGGSSTFSGNRDKLLENITQRAKYSLVVIGDVFMHRPESIRKRMVSEFKGFLTERMKTPVIGEEELGKELKTGWQQFFRLGLFVIIVAVLLGLVMTNQELLLNFFSGEKYESWRVLAILVLVVFVPLFAYSWGSLTRQVLKYMKLD